MDLITEKINQEIELSKIKTNGRYVLSACLLLSLSFVLGLAIGLLYFHFLTFIPVVIGIIIFMVGGLSSLYFFIRASNIKRSNQAKVAELMTDLHKIYFENSQSNPYPDLKFTGIFPNQFGPNNCLHFSWGNEEIIWDIDQETERRNWNFLYFRFPFFFTYNVYTLKCSLISTTQKFSTVYGLAIAEGNSAVANNGLYFQSESMGFNFRFKVWGASEMETFQVFTPKVIDNFLHQPPNFLNYKTIELNNGQASISWRGPESYKSFVPNPLDFSKVHWHTKSKITKDIIHKLDQDFSRYLEVQKMLEPLELYN